LVLQESGFARSTRQAISSLEAVRPRQGVLVPLPVIFVSQSLPLRPADWDRGEINMRSRTP
jgi:hypothetical protein